MASRPNVRYSSLPGEEHDDDSGGAGPGDLRFAYSPSSFDRIPWKSIALALFLLSLGSLLLFLSYFVFTGHMGGDRSQAYGFLALGILSFLPGYYCVGHRTGYWPCNWRLPCTGFSLLVFQLFLYPHLERLLGPVVSSRIAGVLTIPLLSTYPLFAKLSGVGLFVAVNFASLLKNILLISITIGMTILQNNAVEQHQRGAVNGIAMTLTSLFQSVAPAGGGALLSWAQKRQTASFLPGDQVVFFALNVVELLGILLTFRPFLTLRNKPPST